MNGHTNNQTNSQINSKDHCRNLAEKQFDETIKMLEALLEVAQPEKGGEDKNEIESFRILTQNYISNLNENRNKFISNPRENSFTKIHNAQIKVIEAAYQKAKKRKIEVRTGIAKRIINHDDLKNHDYNKKEIIDIMKKNFLADPHVKKLIIYDNTIKDGKKSILVGVKKEPEKNDNPGIIKKWTGKIFSRKNKDEPVEEEPFELHYLNEDDDINKNSSDQIDDIDPVIENWEIAMGNFRRPANELSDTLIQSCVVHALYSNLEERNSLYIKDKETLSSSAISNVSQSDNEFDNKLQQQYEALNNELDILSQQIEIYHKGKALTQKEYEENKKEIESVKITLKDIHDEMKKHGDLTADVKKSLEALPDVNEINMAVDTNQSSPTAILIELKRKLQQMKERTKNLKNRRETMLKVWQEKETKRNNALKVRFDEIDKKTKEISNVIHNSAEEKYEELLKEKGDRLFEHINKISIPEPLKSNYDTSELEELKKQIESEKISLEKTRKEYNELKQKTDEEIANFPEIELAHYPNVSLKSGNSEMLCETLKRNIQRNKEMIENRIQKLSDHIDKLKEKEKELEKRKVAELKKDKLDSDLLELEKKVGEAKLLVKSIAPDTKLEEFYKIEKEMNHRYDLFKKQLDKLDETSQKVLNTIDYDFTIMNRARSSLFNLKSDLKSAHEKLIVVADSKKEQLDKDLLELKKEVETLKNQVNSTNSEITLNKLKEIEEKYDELQNKWDKLDEIAEEVNDAMDYNSSSISQLGCDLAGLEHDIKSRWKSLAKISISKKFEQEYEERLSDKKEKTVYFDKKLGKKVYDFDKITAHAATGSDKWNKTSNLASNLFTSCSSLFFKNNKSSNDNYLSKQGNRSTQTLYHLLNDARNDRDIKAIRPQSNDNPQKQINEIRRELIDQEIHTLRASMNSC